MLPQIHGLLLTVFDWLHICARHAQGKQKIDPKMKNIVLYSLYNLNAILLPEAYSESATAS